MICNEIVRVERSIPDDLSGNIESDAAILEGQLLADFLRWLPTSGM